MFFQTCNCLLALEHAGVRMRGKKRKKEQENKRKKEKSVCEPHLIRETTERVKRNLNLKKYLDTDIIFGLINKKCDLIWIYFHKFVSFVLFCRYF